MNKLIGNAVVGQSGGPTSAINATLAGVIRGALDASATGGAIKTLYGMRNGVEGLLEERLINLTEIFEGHEEKIVALEHTPAAALGSCRKKLPKIAEGAETYGKLLEIFKKYDIRYFFYIGGNDSMDTVAKLSEYMKDKNYEMRIIGVPKTVDNDLTNTDHTPGFGTAAKYVATTIQEIIIDCAVYKIPAVTIVEIMGRNAGWLAASAGLGEFAGGYAPDAVYFPERDFTMEGFFEDVEAAFKKHPNVVIAISEGIRFADGRYVGEGAQSGAVDVFGHKYLAGAAKVLEGEVKNRFGCKARSIELSLPQRCAAHLGSASDINDSIAIGKAAVAAACLEGATGDMMLYKRVSDAPYVCEIEHMSVAGIANAVRFLPDEYINERGNGITEACARYMLPLIEGETYPEYKCGMPVYFSFDK